MILYPEGLEMSNVISIMSEDLSLHLNELIKLKEIQKLFSTKELLAHALNSIDYIKVTDDKMYYVLSDKVVYISFLNIPGKLSKDDTVKILNILDESKITRFYKKYLYWQLVSENVEYCDEIEKTLRSIKIDENTKLRYEYHPTSLKQTLIKKIQQIIYNKEANELKASPEKPVFQNLGSDSGNWRKQSNDYTKDSKDSKDFYKKGQNQGNSYSKSSFNDVPIKRERFNSDGDNTMRPVFKSTKPSNVNLYQSIFSNTYDIDYSKLNVNYKTKSNQKSKFSRS
jgi:hypothetical protein